MKLIVAVAMLLAVVTVKSNDIESTIDFLSKYGYLPTRKANNNTLRIVNADDYSKAVVRYQKFVGLQATGVVDDDTRNQMQRPRCGLADPKKSEKYVLAGKWEKRHLTYRVVKYTKKLDQSDVDRELAKAFNIWANHAKITFSPTKSRSDIEIRFTKYGLPFNPFDGPLGTLAYAFYPQNGDIYFDDSEDWIADTHGFGMSLFYVAVHEIGHALGLAHSNRKDAIMYPYLRTGYNDLNQDDISGIQQLYGPKNPTSYRPTQQYPSYPKRRYPFSIFRRTRYFGKRK